MTPEQKILAELQASGLGVRRRRALLAELGRVGSERSIDALRSNLGRRDLKTKVGAVLALQSLGTDDAVDALVEFLRKQTGTPFALAVHSLGVADARRAIPGLIDILGQRRDEIGDGDKRVVIQTLARMPHRSEVPVLSAMLVERSFFTRRVAAMALSRIRAPESQAALEDAAGSLSWLAGLPVRHELRRRQHDLSE
jgi:HEAT repeat protein